jgi:hypothetical protein
MGRLSKERMQQIWDYELISAWDEKGKNKMWLVIKNFICRINPEKTENYFKVDFVDIVDFLSSTGISRCLDVDHKTGIYGTHAFKSDVIGFIHGRCEKLSMDLINGEPKPLILLGINNYNWIKRDLNHNTKRSRKRRYAKVKSQSLLNVKARDLTDKNWGTIS